MESVENDNFEDSSHVTKPISQLDNILSSSRLMLLEDKIDNLTNKIDNLNSKIDNLNSKIDNLNSKTETVIEYLFGPFKILRNTMDNFKNKYTSKQNTSDVDDQD